MQIPTSHESHESASKGQTFAIFCALKLDVRGCNLTRAQANHILTQANAGEFDKGTIYAEVSALPGAVAKGTPKAQGAPQAAAGESHAQLWARAWQAGKEAAQACKPVPMVVVQRANPLDDNSAIVKRYAPIEGGVCGFAGVRFPGNTSFGKWAKAKKGARPAYGGGYSISIFDYGQSYERKTAHAYAMAHVLSKAGIEARGESRLD